MTCTTLNRRRGVTRGPDAGAGRWPGGQRQRLSRIVSRIGEQLFHYRYVRAELIDRALKRGTDDGREQE